MKIKVKVHANSSQEKIVANNLEYEVWLKEKAINNKANLELLKLLKKHFKKEVKIKTGFTSRNKVVEVLDVCSHPPTLPHLRCW